MIIKILQFAALMVSAYLQLKKEGFDKLKNQKDSDILFNHILQRVIKDRIEKLKKENNETLNMEEKINSISFESDELPPHSSDLKSNLKE